MSIEYPAARAALQRLIDAAFRNPGADRPRFSVPAQQDDDDLLLVAVLDEWRSLRANRIM
jgi:hypothetical protein